MEGRQGLRIFVDDNRDVQVTIAGRGGPRPEFILKLLIYSVASEDDIFVRRSRTT